MWLTVIKFLCSTLSVEVSQVLCAIPQQTVFFSNRVEVIEHPQLWFGFVLWTMFLFWHLGLGFLFRYAVIDFSFGFSDCFWCLDIRLVSVFSGWFSDFAWFSAFMVLDFRLGRRFKIQSLEYDKFCFHQYHPPPSISRRKRWRPRAKPTSSSSSSSIFHCLIGYYQSFATINVE